jgi:hypothetical protein
MSDGNGPVAGGMHDNLGFDDDQLAALPTVYRGGLMCSAGRKGCDLRAHAGKIDCDLRCD